MVDAKHPSEVRSEKWSASGLKCAVSGGSQEGADYARDLEERECGLAVR